MSQNAGPSDELISTLITQKMIEALDEYRDHDETPRGALFRIIRAIPVARYVTIAQEHGLILPDPVADHEERIRDLERWFAAHKHDLRGDTYIPERAR